jgi:hypothetical protein
MKYRVTLTLNGSEPQIFTVWATDGEQAIERAKLEAGDSIHLRMQAVVPETFETIMARIKALPAAEQQALRDEAVADLDERYAGTDEGFGSSDINHTMVALAGGRGI